MCVIAISPAGCRQPNKTDFQAMWDHNPHGAGFMYCSGGAVHIEKGFMRFEDFYNRVRQHHFKAADPVVYHFRISTQAGTSPEMTHPFPLSADPAEHLRLSCDCDIGVAHNGIIQLTSDPAEKIFSDTSIFISDYLARIVRSPSDLESQDVIDTIYLLARSKFAIMRSDGEIATVGTFYKQPGNYLVSNEFYKPVRNFSGWSYSCSNNLHEEA